MLAEDGPDIIRTIPITHRLQDPAPDPDPVADLDPVPDRNPAARPDGAAPVVSAANGRIRSEGGVVFRRCLLIRCVGFWNEL